MNKPTYTEYTPTAEDTLRGILDGIARFLLWSGLLATVIGIGMLLYTYITFAGHSGAPEAQALANIDIFSKVLLAGTIAMMASTAFTFWGEETLAILQLAFAAALYFAPLYLPMALGSVENPPTQAVLRAFQTAGSIAGAFAIFVLLVDISVRVKQRSQQGAKADQLKYGKGVKEERDIQNVFMGKCWQLPFCRKFVRERCPIFHSGRTCWKEKVGCMCEETVIRNAMENKPIPKESVLAANYIPHNNKLTLEQKNERCRQCVIYNEHQKHKYKLWLPITVVAFVGIYVAFRGPLLAAAGNVIQRLDKIVAGATYRGEGTITIKTGVFEELLLIAFIVVLFAYAMKLLETLIFRLKI